MLLPLQNFSTLLQNMSTGLQGSATAIVDLSVGSMIRALLEACASIALWLQWLIVQVLATTRAATSVGSDLDSWMADFSLFRLPGVASTGSVSFSRYAAGLSASIPVGATVRTLDGVLTFAVVEDTTNSAWNGSSGYTFPANSTSVKLPIACGTQGSSGNVLAGAIGLLGTPIPGVDLVSNTASLVGGFDAETDAALRARFQLYVNSRSLATGGAIGSAIQSLQQGLRYSVLENVDPAGNAAPGHFCVVVDDGTGLATSALIKVVASAVDAVRPIGTTFSVSGPKIVLVNVSMSIATSAGGQADAAASLVQQGIIAWIEELPDAGMLALSKLEAIAHQADPSVLSVLSLTVNGTTGDVAAPAGAIIQAGIVTVAAS